MKPSVVVCTHNPRGDYLNRVLTALRHQTLPRDDWELLLIDNVSQKLVASDFDISWHPNGRHIREEKLGLIQARLRGINEADGDLLIFVDDDNVLDVNFLEYALELGAKHPFLGAWGGSIAGEFESPPPVWCHNYLNYLAVREVSGDCWSNDPDHWNSLPFGAGLCVRRVVAISYSKSVATDPVRLQLGRKGTSLMSSEDIDLARSALRLGLGFGVFEKLQLTHLIPTRRVELRYLVELVRDSTASLMILDHIRGRKVPDIRPTFGIVGQRIIRRIRLSSEEWQLYRAQHSEAARLAMDLLK